jgi:hypothetical protein
MIFLLHYDIKHDQLLEEKNNELQKIIDESKEYIMKKRLIKIIYIK